MKKNFGLRALLLSIYASDVNNSTDTFNNNSRNLNAQRKEALDNWNKTVNEFFSEHTPRYK